EAAPDQTEHRQEQHRVADIGMDRAVEKAVRPRRDVIHPRAIGDHADDRDTENPVEGARDIAPARRGISDHVGLELPVVGGLLSACALRPPATARPDSFLSEPRRFELFQIKPPDGASLPDSPQKQLNRNRGSARIAAWQLLRRSSYSTPALAASRCCARSS